MAFEFKGDAKWGVIVGGMEIEKRVTRWARTACTVLEATRTVLVAARRLVITATLLATALAGLVIEVVYLLQQ